MIQPEKRRLERVQYWQGQRLRSNDFLDLEAVEAQRRWWHNRAVHQAYGVHEGFTTSAAPGGTQHGVVVSPGVAYDVYGHELILERAAAVPLPVNLQTRGPSTAALLIRYSPPPRDIAANRLTDVCFTRTRSITTGTVEFFWKLAGHVKPSDGVMIGKLSSSTGKYGPESSVRLSSSFVPAVPRPIASPLLASGATVAGNTPWQAWNYLTAGEVGVQTFIDTSAAGFTRIPCYFAWLQGPLWNPPTMQLVPSIFPSISGESLTGFTFSLWLEFPQPNFVIEIEERAAAPAASISFVTTADAFKAFAQQQQLYVCWIGCQMAVPISSCAMRAGPTSADTVSALTEIS